jgi:predicted nuclease of restriction endonuclease-like (RecB) superfamily
VRQLERQLLTQFYERTLLSRNKRAMLVKGEVRRTGVDANLHGPVTSAPDTYVN